MSRVRVVYGTALGEGHAVRLAADIKKAKGSGVEIVKGTGDVFDVHVDEKLVFSRQTEHRFPEAFEIIGEMD